MFFFQLSTQKQVNPFLEAYMKFCFNHLSCFRVSEEKSFEIVGGVYFAKLPRACRHQVEPVAKAKNIRLHSLRKKDQMHIDYF